MVLSESILKALRIDYRGYKGGSVSIIYLDFLKSLRLLMNNRRGKLGRLF
jgi:hypothetical protein